MGQKQGLHCFPGYSDFPDPFPPFRRLEGIHSGSNFKAQIDKRMKSKDFFRVFFLLRADGRCQITKRPETHVSAPRFLKLINFSCKTKMNVKITIILSQLLNLHHYFGISFSFFPVIWFRLWWYIHSVSVRYSLADRNNSSFFFPSCHST